MTRELSFGKNVTTLPALDHLLFKDEDEENGRIYGPLTAFTKDGAAFKYNDGEWISHSTASIIAKKMKLPPEYC